MTVDSILSEQALHFDAISVIQNDLRLKQENIRNFVLSEVAGLATPYDFNLFQNNMIRVEATLLGNDVSILTNQDWEDIVATAQACPREVGTAVGYARALYYRIGGPHPTSYDNSCESLDLRESRPENDLRIYPNPFTDEFVISSETYDQAEKLVITDVVGNIVYEAEEVTLRPETTIKLDGAAGIYVVTLYIGNQEHAKKVIKLK